MITPQSPAPGLADALGLTAPVYLKREDLHPYGSHKGRSIPHMIETYAAQGIRHFAISSSGNAALAAAHAIQEYNTRVPNDPFTIQIFVGQHIPETKLKKILPFIGGGEEGVSIHQVTNPKQQAFQIDKLGEAKNLRQSTDDLALAGYQTLADELNEIPNLQAIFIPTSSGTTAQALGEAFEKLGKKIQIHIVQTTTCHTIAEVWTKLPLPAGEGRVRSIATAIVDHVAHRKQHVIDAIKKSGGAGWITTDEEIQQAIALVKQTCDLDISPNSALSIAGLIKTIQNDWRWSGHIACLVTGQ